MNLLTTVRKIRACEGEAAAQLLLEKVIAEYKQRAEAAEAKLRELEMQEPVGEINFVDNRYPGSGTLAYCITPIKGATKHGQKLYAKPFPAPKQEEQ